MNKPFLRTLERYDYGVPEDRASLVRSNERAIIHAQLARAHRELVMLRKSPDWRFASWLLLKLMAEIGGTSYQQEVPEEIKEQ